MKKSSKAPVVERRKRGSLSRYTPEWAIKYAVYLVLHPHATKTDVYRDLGLNAPLDNRWMDQFPLWRYAREYAETVNKPRLERREGFDEFIISRMTPETKELYEKLVFWEDNPDQWSKYRTKVLNLGDKERKRMFVQIMAANAFTMSKACRIMGISRDTAENWAKTSQGFHAMLRELENLKKDYFEEALIDLVAQRDSPAVIFANKTKNRDRGYGDKLDVAVKGKIDHQHTHTVVPLAALEQLPTETLELILAAVQEHKQKQMAAQAAGPGVLSLPSPEGETIELDPAQDEESR